MRSGLSGAAEVRIFVNSLLNARQITETRRIILSVFLAMKYYLIKLTAMPDMYFSFDIDEIGMLDAW